MSEILLYQKCFDVNGFTIYLHYAGEEIVVMSEKGTEIMRGTQEEVQERFNPVAHPLTERDSLHEYISRRHI